MLTRWCGLLTELMVEPVDGWGLIEWTRLEAETINAPRANPNDASTFTVTLRAPIGISCVRLMSGRRCRCRRTG
jgi:hypothetical protein